jgi:hypothetical protein
MPDISTGPFTAGPPNGSVDEAERWQAAKVIRRQHPRWVVIWAAGTGRYHAWPLFRAPRGTALTAQEPAELVAQMKDVEQAARSPRATSRNMDDDT